MGGNTWAQIGNSLHVDHHALYIHSANPNFMVEGNDGGVLYFTKWRVPVGFFRPCPSHNFILQKLIFSNPFGFTVERKTTVPGAPPTRIQLSGIIFGGAMGFVTLVNPNNNAIWYAEWQYGGFGGSNGATKPPFSRANWNAPYVFDPKDPNIMYFGGARLFKSIDGGLNWVAISDDLSNNIPGNLVYGTIASIAVSPVDENVIWVGTDDGNVWVTNNGGNTWTQVSDSLPNRWITRLVADPYDADAAWVCLSGYRHADDMAHSIPNNRPGRALEFRIR